MELTYYPDTDTLAIVLADGPAARTETPTEDVVLDWDANDKLIMVTIEHPENIPGFDRAVVVRTLPPKLAS